MAHYELPARLIKKYKEKIDVGYFKIPWDQFLYIVILGLMIFFILVAHPINDFVTYTISGMILVVGLYFISLGYEGSKIMMNYELKDKELGWFDETARNYIKLKKIDYNTVFLGGGKMGAILQVSPINLDTMEQGDVEAFNRAYSDFLNSLDYPIQLVVRSISLDLHQYFSDLKKRVQDTCPEFFGHFQALHNSIEEFIEKNATSNKIYLLVIPYNKRTLESEKDALEALDRRVKTCRKMLLNAGIVTTRLQDHNLISLLGGYFSRYGELNADYLSMFSFYKKEEVIA